MVRRRGYPTDWNGLWLNEGSGHVTVEMLWTIDQGFLKDADWVTLARAEDCLLTRGRGTAAPPIRVISPRRTSTPDRPCCCGQIHKAVGDEAFYAMGRDWVQRNRNPRSTGRVHPGT
jgi:hypothetical protein